MVSSSSSRFQDTPYYVSYQKQPPQQQGNPEKIPGFVSYRACSPLPKTSGVRRSTVFSYLIIGLVVAVLVWFVVMPAVQGSLHFYIMGSDSMSPEINMGDVVVASEVSSEEVVVGSVITFMQDVAPDDERCITHRVVDVVSAEGLVWFQTKGDANDAPDPVMVKSSEVVGEVVLTIPYIGHLPYMVRSVPGLLALLLFPGLVILVHGMRSRRRLLVEKADNCACDE